MQTELPGPSGPKSPKPSAEKSPQGRRLFNGRKKTLKEQERQQVSYLAAGAASGSERRSPEVARRGQREAVKFHNYRQTGVKSRPVKLLKHPIEHIERKIIITYIIGFLFKLIAILSGPLIVLLAYLLVLPSILVRRSIWFLLNLSCLFDARIRTSSSSYSPPTDDDCRRRNEKSLNWNYCPLSYLESFWLKEKLVNNVILVIDQEEEEAAFSIDKFRDLIREAILCRPAYRKFLSRVVPRGLPFYKSYFWQHLGLATPIPVPADITRLKANNGLSRGQLAADLSRSTSSEFSITKSVSSQSAGGEFVRVLLKDSSEGASHLEGEDEEDNPPPKLLSKVADEREADVKVYLSNHIYIDSYFINNKSEQEEEAGSSREKAKLRRYAYSLTEVNLDMTRPLWEIRVLPTRSRRRTYLIFRCHQSLADGHSLTAILTDHLTTAGASAAERGLDDDDDGCGDRKIFNPSGARDGSPEAEAEASESKNGKEVETEIESEENRRQQREAMMERKLRPIGEKKSFVSRVSKANSFESSVLVGPLTVLLWVIWTFSRRKDNHLNKCRPAAKKQQQEGMELCEGRRFYMTHYDLTKFHQIKQMTRSTVSDVILCALSGALRNYLRKFNGVSNPPTLNVSLTVNMRQEASSRASSKCKPGLARQVNQMGQPSGSSSSSPEEARSSSVIMMAPAACQPQQQKQPIKAPPEVPPEAEEEAQVNCTLLNVPLPTSVEGTVPRLWELRTTMDELRTSADPWVMLGLQKILFLLLPISWYQWLINYIALRNSSIFVSNIRGPANVVESWCVDLFQRAIYEAQQAPRRFHPTTSSKSPREQQTMTNDNSPTNGQEEGEEANKKLDEKEEWTGGDKKMRNSSKLRLINKLGCLSSIYYCMEPPTSEIPISFNCITYHNKLFVTSLSRSLLVEDSKLLIKLFFAQLNQLADTIAKRKCFYTIIRTPIPIEISCQPASPVLDKSKNFTKCQRDGTETSLQTDDDDDDDEDNFDRKDIAAAATSSGSEPDEQEEEDGGREIKLKEELASKLQLAGEFDKRKFGQGVGKLSPLATTKLSAASIATRSNNLGQTKRMRRRQFMKDDIEANLGPETASKCSKCRQFVCTCRRRKSLFSLDTNQRSANLFSLLHPNYYIAGGRRESKSNELPESAAADSILSQQQQQQIANNSECLCGQQLLEELDEDLDEPAGDKRTCSNDLLNNFIGEEKESPGSRTPSDDGRSGARVHRGAAGARRGSNCAKCSYNSARSLVSLADNQPEVNQHHTYHPNTSKQHNKTTINRLYINRDQQSDVMNRSNSSLSSGGGGQRAPHNSTYLTTRFTDDKIGQHKVSKCYSKSETDLLPMNTTKSKSTGSGSKRALSKEPSTNPSVNKESWFVIGRKGNRKISTIFPKTPFNSSFKIRRAPASSSPVSPNYGRNRNLIETSLDLINTHMPSRRRQSVATTTGASSSIHKSIVVKDEINADVNLRYHLDGSILRTRRFSTIGSAVVGTQRRSSLIPFGLMNNQAFPKLLREDGETHL